MIDLRPARLEDKKLFKIPELARFLGITPQAVHLWLLRGRIRHTKRTSKTGNYLIPRHETIRLLKKAGREVPGLWTRLRKKILVIDDCAAIRSLVRAAFRDPALHLEVRTIASVEDGLVMAATFMPHVIVLDDAFEADRLQGEAATTLITKATAFKKIKVIAMAADRTTGTKMLEAGADVLLQKPFGLEELRRAIYTQAFAKRRIRYTGKPLHGLVSEAIRCN